MQHSCNIGPDPKNRCPGVVRAVLGSIPGQGHWKGCEMVRNGAYAEKARQVGLPTNDGRAGW
jgi:hypothetical protein